MVSAPHLGILSRGDYAAKLSFVIGASRESVHCGLMSDEDSDVGRRPLPPLDDDYLRFMRDEGLDMLALFRHIRDREKRELVMELMRTIVGDQPKTDGGS